LEIGSGMPHKTGVLVGAMCDQASVNDVVYVPFDISREAIDASPRTLLAVYAPLHVLCVDGNSAHIRSSVASDAPDGPRLFAFLGSTIGNLDEQAAPAFVAQIAALMHGGDSFLLGIDLVKDERVLHAAYNDSAGVTAEFNRNILRVLARELDADFE